MDQAKASGAPGRSLANGFERRLLVAMGLPMMASCWALLWSVDSYWNPLFFMGMWGGATLLLYAGGVEGYPGVGRHLRLVAVSIPLWWWFEVVNRRVQNWTYLGGERYDVLEYALLATLAFSTVAPALHAAWGLTTRAVPPAAAGDTAGERRGYAVEIGLGVALQGAVFALPAVLFPLVWVAPFLVLDGLVGYGGGRNLVREMMSGEWRLAIAVGLGGLLCGVLWEFWNFWATPKWVYQIPLFDFGHVFEMPFLGYGGYVPFAWSVYQLLQVGPLRRFVTGSANAPGGGGRVSLFRIL